MRVCVCGSFESVGLRFIPCTQNHRNFSCILFAVINSKDYFMFTLFESVFIFPFSQCVVVVGSIRFDIFSLFVSAHQICVW